jgi:hypothetical protein
LNGRKDSRANSQEIVTIFEPAREEVLRLLKNDSFLRLKTNSLRSGEIHELLSNVPMEQRAGRV